MRTIHQAYLKASWKNYYVGFKKHFTDEYERDERCKVFNEILRDELLRAQKAGRKFNYDEVCSLCDEINRRVYDLGATGSKDFDVEAIKGALHGTTVTGAMAFVDPSGKSYEFAHMHYFGHLPVEGLTPNEIAFFMDCLGGSIDDAWGVLIFTVLRTKIHNYDYILSHEMQIDRLCKNAIYERVNDKMLEKAQVDLGFKTGKLDRIRDYFVRRLM